MTNADDLAWVRGQLEADKRSPTTIAREARSSEQSIAKVLAGEGLRSDALATLIDYYQRRADGVVVAPPTAEALTAAVEQLGDLVVELRAELARLREGP